jgi:hypothetical protein
VGAGDRVDLCLRVGESREDRVRVPDERLAGLTRVNATPSAQQ